MKRVIKRNLKLLYLQLQKAALQLYIFRSYIIIINGQRLGPVLSEALI
jgi:hypothetical protein